MSAACAHPFFSFCSFERAHSSLFSRNLGCIWLRVACLPTLTLTLHHLPHRFLTPWIDSEFQERAHNWTWWASHPSRPHLGQAAPLQASLPVDFQGTGDRIWKCGRRWLSCYHDGSRAQCPGAQTRFAHWLCYWLQTSHLTLCASIPSFVKLHDDNLNNHNLEG